MKILFFLVTTVALATFISANRRDGKRGISVEEKKKFKAWRNNFHKQYASQAEEDAAMEKMLANKEKIDAHNKLHDEGKVTFRRGLWKHSDMSDDDKKKFLLGAEPPPETRSAPALPDLQAFPSGPDEVDWVTEGLVGPVMDQGW